VLILGAVVAVSRPDDGGDIATVDPAVEPASR
jgi:hypothetical protein